jgi:hypothetical protein
MPWEKAKTEIRQRIREPNLFSKMRYKEMGKGISSIFGQLKSNPKKWVVQALRFKIDDGWTIDKAKEWYQKHGGKKSFEEVELMEGIRFFVEGGDPYVQLESDGGNFVFDKEVIYAGSFIEPSSDPDSPVKERIKITPERLKRWLENAKKYGKKINLIRSPHPENKEDYLERDVGFIEPKEVKIKKDSQGRLGLFGTHRFTDEKYGLKVEEGSARGVSIGVKGPIAHPKTGEKIDEYLDHICLTNKEHVVDLDPFEKVKMEDGTEQELTWSLFFEEKDKKVKQEDTSDLELGVDFAPESDNEEVVEMAEKVKEQEVLEEEVTQEEGAGDDQEKVEAEEDDFQKKVLSALEDIGTKFGEVTKRIDTLEAKDVTKEEELEEKKKKVEEAKEKLEKAEKGEVEDMEIAELKKQLESQKLDLEELRLEKEAREIAEIDSKLGEMVRTKKLEPREKDTWRKIVLEMRKSPDKIEFEEGESITHKKILELLESRKPVIAEPKAKVELEKLEGKVYTKEEFEALDIKEKQKLIEGGYDFYGLNRQ